MRYLLLLTLFVLPGCWKFKDSLSPGNQPPFTITAGLTFTNRSAEQLHGQDYLALQLPAFRVADAAASKPGGVTGNLDNTFGASLAPVRQLLNLAAPLAHRVHLINGPCIRNGNCGKYEAGYGYTKESFSKALEKKNAKLVSYLRNRAFEYRTLAADFPQTKFYISPVLEHDVSKAAWRVAADSVLSAWPDAALVNSPDGGIGIERYRDALVERHGSAPQSDADIVSTDGASADQIDIKAFLSRVRNSKIVMLWTGGYNCRVPEWVDPRKRKACSTAKSLALMPHLFDPALPAPALSAPQCKSVKPFAAPAIWKPLAERHLNYDQRQELPVLITKAFSSKAVNVIGAHGQKVGSLGYFGTYLDQGLRWYSGYPGGSRQSGYEFQNSGQSVWLHQGSKCLGPIIPGRRQGLMRDK